MIQRAAIYTLYLILLKSIFMTFTSMTRRRGVVVVTTVLLYSKKPELRFCASSNPPHILSEICNVYNIQQLPHWK